MECLIRLGENNPTQIQAHCLVTRADTRPKPAKELVLPTHGQTEEIMHETLTHGIVHAGFSGMRAFVARKKSLCKLIGFRFVIPHDTIPSNVISKAKNISDDIVSEK